MALFDKHVTRDNSVSPNTREAVIRFTSPTATTGHQADLHLYDAICFICFAWDTRYDLYGMKIRIKAASAFLSRQLGQWSCSFIPRPVCFIFWCHRHRKPWDHLMKSDPCGEVWNADRGLRSIHLPALARIISLKGFIFQWSSPLCWPGFSKLQGFFCHGVGSDHTSSFSQWLWSHIAP